MFVKFVINDWCTKKMTGLKLFTNDVTETHKTLTRKLASFQNQSNQTYPKFR